jgi:hypothetical protein
MGNIVGISSYGKLRRRVVLRRLPAKVQQIIGNDPFSGHGFWFGSKSLNHKNAQGQVRALDEVAAAARPSSPRCRPEPSRMRRKSVSKRKLIFRYR